MEPNFERLELVVKATETLPLGLFDMGTVFEHQGCGTAGCMIGNYNALAGRIEQCFGLRDETHPDWDHFGVTAAEYCWLFSFGAFDADDGPPLATDWCPRSEDGDDDTDKMYLVTREQALSRLRKFIAYKRRKHELIHDRKYGVSEAARRAEGNRNFVMLAVKDAAAGIPSLAVAQ